MVAFTPNIGLAQPLDSELASDWVDTGGLYNGANNSIITDKTDVNLLPFGSVLKGKTSDPNMGVGGIRFDYQEFQGFVWGTFVVTFNNPGVAAGVGEYGISLPFVADASFHSVGSALDWIPGFNNVIGEGFAQDVSSPTTSGICAVDIVTVSGVSYARLATQTYAGKTGRCIGGGTGPFTVADGDRLTGSFFYKHV